MSLVEALAEGLVRGAQLLEGGGRVAGVLDLERQARHVSARPIGVAAIGVGTLTLILTLAQTLALTLALTLILTLTLTLTLTLLPLFPRFPPGFLLTSALRLAPHPSRQAWDRAGCCTTPSSRSGW